MNKLVVTTLLMSIFASASACANDKYDLKCMLDSGDVMTLSHGSGTVYIEFLGANDDPDEGGSVIKLDILSGGAQQTLNKSAVGTQSFTLRGTDDDIEGAVAIGYDRHEGKQTAYFSLMNQMGKEVQSHTCKPETIRAQNALLTEGIAEIEAQHQKTQPNKSGATSKIEPSTAPSASPIKVGVDERLFQYGSVKTPYRTVNITSIAEGLIINSVIVNRNQCSSSVGNPNKAFELPFGRTVTYDYNIQSRRCDVVEIVVKTNKGDWTLAP
ncbi:hypothetical protein [Pseudomonas purpurea]|uniref:hypothetical protein n=1 Tax=Pseudomonas purpurea TaxID=3136737 RepID=UPI0032645B15